MLVSLYLQEHFLPDILEVSLWMDLRNRYIVLWEKDARLFVQHYFILFLPFDQNMELRDPTLPHLSVTMEEKYVLGKFHDYIQIMGC